MTRNSKSLPPPLSERGSVLFTLTGPCSGSAEQLWVAGGVRIYEWIGSLRIMKEIPGLCVLSQGDTVGTQVAVYLRPSNGHMETKN